MAYTEDPIVRSFVQKCIALSFIPPEEVVSKFEELVCGLDSNKKNDLDIFINYFRHTWLNGLYQIAMWSKYGCDHRHRTNNAMEGWHSQLKRLLPIHPNIFIFIHGLKKMQAITHMNISKADAGASPPQRKPKYVKLEVKLKKYYEMHQRKEINTDTLLSKVQHCVNLAKK